MKLWLKAEVVILENNMRINFFRLFNRRPSRENVASPAPSMSSTNRSVIMKASIPALIEITEMSELNLFFCTKWHLCK